MIIPRRTLLKAGAAGLIAAPMLIRPKRAVAGTVTQSIGSAGGRDFATLQAWANALPANLVTDGNSYVGQCYNDSEFTGSSVLLTLSGHTTDASHTITLTTGPGQSFRDNANVRSSALNYNQTNGVGINCSSAADPTIKIDDNYVFLKNLQIKSTGTSGFLGTVDSLDGGVGKNGIVQNCIIVGARQALRLEDGWSVGNCLVVSTGSGGLGYAQVGTNSVYFLTLVATNGSATALYTQSGTTMENVAIFGFGTLQANVDPTFTTSMTDLSSAISGLTGGKTFANQFVNTASDWRTKSGADLIGAGTADSTNGAFDISNFPRPQNGKWDIGAWEYQSGFPPGPPSICPG